MHENTINKQPLVCKIMKCFFDLEIIILRNEHKMSTNAILIKHENAKL